MSTQSLGYAQADKRIELLRRVGESGSISQAARSAGVSYKAAWQAIHTLTNLAGEPLVDSSVGGAGGGGARLTAAGARLLHAAEHMDAARHDVLARINDPAAQARAFLRELTHILQAVFSALLRRESPYASVLAAVLELAGEKAQAVKIPDEPTPRSRTSRSSSTDSIVEAFGKSFARQLGTKSGQALVRGVLGSLFRGK